MAVIGPTSSRISLNRLPWRACCVLLAFHFVLGTANVVELKGSLNSSVFSFTDQSNQEAETEMDCIDWEGKPVADGEKYIPFGSDLCMQCLCENRFPILCQSVACSAPQNCPDAKPIAGKCCEYDCMPGDSNNGGNGTGIGKDPTKDTEESITNLSLRLIASTVTSLLFLALLLFMVYRLRQRRLLLAMRRFEARSRNSNNEDTDSEHYIPDNLLSLECPPYTDPPPPYSPPKPPHIYQGEQPPPYDEISMTGNFDGREANGILQPGHSATVGEITPVTANRSQGQPGQVTRCRELPQSAVDSQGQTTVRYPVETLPAYASTDVVQGLDSILTTRAPASQRHWNNNRYGDRCAVPMEPRNTLHERNGSVNASSGHPCSLDRTANERHNMPTVTAFQRFSSLFKRNAPKSKNRNSQTRPISECHPPPQYTTLPHESSNSSPGGYMRFNNSGWQSRSSGRSATRSLTDRMCFSYDSARAAYELAAMSPSTSSNSSSSLGPPSNSPRRREGNQQNPLQTQQFQDDLRRHLPPLQTSDSSEFMTQTSPGTCPSTLSPSSSSVNQTPVCQRVSSEGCEQTPCLRTIPHLDHARDNDIGASRDGEVSPSIVYDLTGSLQHLTSSPSTPSSGRVPVSDRLEERQRCVQSARPPTDFPRTSTSHQSSSTYSSSDLALRTDQEPGSSSSNADNSRNVCNNKTPSPPVLAGVMRRSQSGISVCSETGEKKLRDGKGNVDLKVLASDSQYPEHHSLSRCKPGMLSRKPESPLSKQVEETNVNVLNSSSYSSHPKDAPRNSSQVPATLFVPPVHSVGDGGGKTEGRVVSSQESPVQGEPYGACVQENDLNKGPDTQAGHNPSALITSLNICPPSPFVTVQSGQLIPVSFGKRNQHGGPAEQEVRLAAHTKNLPQEGRKIKKKKNGKDKHPAQPSPRHRPSQKPKHATNPSPGNGGPTSSKSNVPCQDMQPRISSTKFRPARGGEKKKQKAVGGGLTLPVDVLDSSSVDWMSHSYDDACLSGYGNADVYRSYCCDAIPAKSVQPTDYPSVQGYPSDKIALGTSGENRAYSHGYHVADRTSGQPKSYLAERPSQPPLTKKKPTHKHAQASVGERIPYGSSPSRQRPKSLAGSGDRGHGRRGEPPESTSFEHSRHSAGKGAKSGFGQDLNFDNQLGMIDFFNHGVDYSAAKTAGRSSFSNDSTNVPVGANGRSHARGVSESGNHHHHQHGNSRSGLSNDLSFVNGSHPAVEKGRKRASLPSLPMFSCHSQGGSGLNGRNQPGKMDERVEREDRHRNSVPDDSLSQATSYV